VKTVFTNDAQSVAVVAVVIAIASILIACVGVCCLCGCFSRGAGGAKNNPAMRGFARIGVKVRTMPPIRKTNNKPSIAL
jgi:hypothetical protein